MGGAVTVIGKQTRVFYLKAFAVEHVVLGLFHHGFVQVVALCDLNGGQDIARRPFGCAPVKRFAGFYDVVHGPYGFLNAAVLRRVRTVGKDQVNVVQLETFQ